MRRVIEYTITKTAKASRRLPESQQSRLELGVHLSRGVLAGERASPAEGASDLALIEVGPCLANGEDARRTTSNTIEIGSVVIVKLLCKRSLVLVLRERRMGRFSSLRKSALLGEM